jgi:hypothetical protein
MTSWFSRNYTKVVLAGAIYDVVSTGPFAFPLLAEANLAQLRKLHGLLGFTGSFPAFEPFHLLFVYLMGSMVLVWAGLRIWRREPVFGLVDGLAEVLFCAWLAHGLARDVSGVLGIFLVLEIPWCLVHIGGYLLWRKARRAEGGDASVVAAGAA